MKKFLGIVFLSLLFSSISSAKEYVCVQEAKKENKIFINVKPMFGLKKSYSNIEIQNLPKEHEKMGDLNDKPFRWAEIFYIPDQKIFNTLFFEFHEEGYVTEKNPKFDPERPYLTKYKPDRLVLYMNKRGSILWDQEMFNNPDKKIVFEACIKKPNFLDKIFK